MKKVNVIDYLTHDHYPPSELGFCLKIICGTDNDPDIEVQTNGIEYMSDDDLKALKNAVEYLEMLKTIRKDK